jgi:endonuclease/exonuclease/phosphatase family metal-dependent hydrolase
MNCKTSDWWRLLALGLALPTLGCGDSESEAPHSGDSAVSDAEQSDAAAGDDAGSGDAELPDGRAPTNELALATFNAGLAPNFVPYATERVGPIVEALSALDADVVCLQEVWLPEDIEALVDGTKAAFPHAHWELTTEVASGEPPACTVEEAGPLVECVEENCVDAEDFVGCALASCSAELGAISPGCQACVAANLDKPLAEIQLTCTSGATEFAYGGHNGLLLLSRQALADTDFRVLDSSLVQRAALYGRTDGGLHVYCTHLAADLSEIQPYTGDFGTFEGEQARQIALIEEWIAERAPDAPTALLGDLNTGPAAGAAEAELLANYEALRAAGWTSAYANEPGADCTYCADNPIVAEGKSAHIDHVLLRGGAASAGAERILDGPLSLVPSGGPEDGRLSDHYGVRAAVQWPIAP